MNRAELIASIMSNPKKHQVDRDAKMNATIDVMCENLELRHKLKGKAGLEFNERDARGYGQGRKQGD